jgi:hydrogenase maturation protein HypF
MAAACSIRVRGVVQGVGFRPFVYRLAHANMLTGWVLNGDQGVEIHLEGIEEDLATFVREIKRKPPAAACIAEMLVESAPCEGLSDFTIRESVRLDRPTVRVSPDLPVCDECLAELFDPSDRRFCYPYINCTNCGPRYSVIHALPYDRPNTTMRNWPMDRYCSHEYYDPANRRFHAQPVACPACVRGILSAKGQQRSPAIRKQLTGLLSSSTTVRSSRSKGLAAITWFATRKIPKPTLPCVNESSGRKSHLH